MLLIPSNSTILCLCLPVFQLYHFSCLIQDCSLVPCSTLDLLIFFVFSFFFHAFAALRILYYVVICCFMCSGWLLIFDQPVLLVHHHQPSHGFSISREFLKCINLMKRQIYGNQFISLFSWILVICHVVVNTQLLNICLIVINTTYLCSRVCTVDILP